MFLTSPNRLPFYEVIFENIVTDQTPRYELLQAASEPVEREVTEGVKDKDKVKAKGKKSSKKSEEEGLSEHELKLARDMLLINHGQGITSSIVSLVIPSCQGKTEPVVKSYGP